MPTPYSRLTTANVNSLASTTLGNLKPYQLKQVQEWLARFNWKPKGSQSDVSTQPTITTIIAAVTPNS